MLTYLTITFKNSTEYSSVSVHTDNTKLQLLMEMDKGTYTDINANIYLTIIYKNTFTCFQHKQNNNNVDLDFVSSFTTPALILIFT